jgi:selenocysteine lyase/cysteine desulfurase
VYEVARILHRHQALAFFDFSASAPYVEINVRRDDECYFDGVFFSPHKFLGGPGASGILLIREDLYRRDLPPSVSGGGTVRFVNARTQDYVEDIEEREKAGTPGILQTIRAALAMDLQHQLGRAAIERREQELIRRAFERLDAVPQIEIIGDAPAEHRLSILSFNLRAGESYLHPRFVVRLLNDLFGIQSRAGCSCAGPYGHRLLHIDIETSERYRRMIRRGDEGIKPGWVRLNFHYLIDDDEFAFLLSAIEFVAEYGELFLQEYRFDLHSGAWVHRKEPELESEPAMDQVLASGMPVPAPGAPTVDEGELSTVRRRYLKEAQVRASQLKDTFVPEELHRTPNELIPFSYLNTVSS